MSDWVGRYMTKDEIVDDLIQNQWSEKDKETLRGMPKRDLILYHHGLGTWIRNFYGLWREDNPYSKVNATPNAQGVIDDPLFPDQISHRILETAWDRLRNSKVVEAVD